MTLRGCSSMIEPRSARASARLGARRAAAAPRSRGAGKGNMKRWVLAAAVLVIGPPSTSRAQLARGGNGGDEQLSREAKGLNTEAEYFLKRATHAGFRLSHGGYYEELDLAAASKKASAEDREAAADLSRRVSAAAQLVNDELAKANVVRLRECRQAQQRLQELVSAAPAPAFEDELADARRRTRECVEQLGPPTRALHAAVDGLWSLLCTVDEALARPAPTLSGEAETWAGGDLAPVPTASVKGAATSGMARSR